MITWKRTSLLTRLVCVPRVWYYINCLHLWRSDEIFEITFKFKWKQPASKGLLTNNFCLLNRFWLSENPLLHPSLFLTYNIKLDGMPTKIKCKMQACFILHFKFFEGTSVESYTIQLLVLLVFVLHQFLYQ